MPDWLIFLQVVAQHVVLPPLFAYWLTGGRYIRIFNIRTRMQALLLYAASAAFFLFILLCGAWHIVGYWLRPVTALLFLAATAGFLTSLRGAPRQTASFATWAVCAFYAAMAAVFGGGAALAIAGRFAPAETIDLAFPLSGGLYVVGQGGSSVAVNYHNAYRTQTYALDILKLNAFGFRAAGLAPRDPARYAIFGDLVTSPCDGTVVFMRDGLEDARGAQRDADAPAGNTVVLDCDGATVLLAHFMKDSIVVAEGEAVGVGAPLGRVGNSGNTSEPHLHIHAEQGPYAGERFDNPGLAIRFNGRFLARGDLIRGDSD